MTVGITELPPEGMQLAGVALSGDPDRGTRTTEGLSLLFTTAGITVQGPQPQIERLLVWSGLDTASCGERVELPDGRDAAVMELTSGGQSIRFLLPTENVTPGQAAYLDQALPTWLARYKASPAHPSPAAGDDGAVPIAGTTATGGQGEGQPASGVSPAAGNGSVRGTVAAAPAATRAPAPTFSSPPAPASPGSASGPPAGPPPTAPTTGPASLIPPPPGAPGAGVATPPPPPPATAAPPTPVGGPPPPDRPDAAAPAKKAKGWLRSRSTPPPVPPPGALAPTEPPAQPPKHPVPLKLATLPPPANGATSTATAKGPVIWKPPVDPVTGEAQWDGPLGGPAPPPPGTAVPPVERRRGLRRWGKGGTSLAAAGTAAVTARPDNLPAPPPAAPTDPAVEAGPVDAPRAGGSNGATTPVRPVEEAAPPTPPVTAPAPTPKLSAPEAGQALKRKRITLVVLVVVLAAVVGGIAYVASNRTTSPKTAVPPVAAPPHSVAADTALAASINLRLNDLPASWTNGTAAGQGTRPPVAPANAQVQADQAMATCLGVSYPTVAGLFGGAAIPGQTGSATSPTFQSGTDPDIQMYTTTTVLGTATQAQALAAPFTEPNFVTCFGNYQTSLVSAAVPGATAQIEVVTLAPPAGVKAYGYLTTLTIPGEGTEVIGEGFMIGGRIESKIEPTTNGPTVPTDAFNSAFNAVSGRVAEAQHR